MTTPRPKTLILSVAALLFGAGAVAFARERRPSETTLPRLAEHPATRHDLVDFHYGPTVRASSSAFAFQHHPVFVVDGLATPSPTEKWVSDAVHDHAPWLEVSWGSPRQVDEVDLTWAGAFEGARLTPAHYTLRCLGAPGELEVSGNVDPRPHHPLACAGATGLRIDFDAALAPPNDVARAYEVEVYGQ